MHKLPRGHHRATPSDNPLLPPLRTHLGLRAGLEKQARTAHPIPSASLKPSPLFHLNISQSIHKRRGFLLPRPIKRREASAEPLMRNGCRCTSSVSAAGEEVESRLLRIVAAPLASGRAGSMLRIRPAWRRKAGKRRLRFAAARMEMQVEADPLVPLPDQRRKPTPGGPVGQMAGEVSFFAAWILGSGLMRSQLRATKLFENQLH